MSSAESAKTRIIERIFRSRWNASTRKLSDALVTLRQVSDAIREDRKAGGKLSDRNPANFFKDFIRNRRRANENWPKYVLKAGHTGRQRTGKGRCFEFVPLAPGQVLPFSLDLIPDPDDSVLVIEIPTVNIPIASRRLGRPDEAWLVQVLVRLRVIETHLALVSKANILQLEHLQTNIKLSAAEVDALFLAVEGRNGDTNEFMITLEAKGRNDDILEGQILDQVRATFRIVDHDLILPMAAKAFAPSKIHVVEFNKITRRDADAAERLGIASRAVYRLKPSIPGIGERGRRPKSYRSHGGLPRPRSG